LRFALTRAGIESEQVPLASRDADLRLVDRVAPYDSARWYLRTACAPCGEDAEAAIEAARIAPTPDERARAIALADAALDRDAAFIPLMRPIRWSLVSLRLARFQGNSRAAHPLDQLRNESD
jgi:peptide/nickel transport system substrate-binding protein